MRRVGTPLDVGKGYFESHQPRCNRRRRYFLGPAAVHSRPRARPPGRDSVLYGLPLVRARLANFARDGVSKYLSVEIHTRHLALGWSVPIRARFLGSAQLPLSSARQQAIFGPVAHVPRIARQVRDPIRSDIITAR